MRTDNDTVSGFQADKTFEDSGRCGVGRRDNSTYNSDRLRNFCDAVARILLNNAAGLNVLVRVVDVFGSVVIFDNLILYDTHFRFFNSHFRKRNSLLIGSGSGS